jgi:hypothetical protein
VRLRDHGALYGIEAQFFENGNCSRRTRSRPTSIDAHVPGDRDRVGAEETRRHLERE